MTLSTGARLGPYEVVAFIGQGGMGEVYRARDLKLHREVAVKVLPDPSQTMPNGSPASNVKHRCSLRSIIRTSRQELIRQFSVHFPLTQVSI